VGRGNRSTSSRMSVPRTRGRGRRVPRVAWFCGVGCNTCDAYGRWIIRNTFEDETTSNPPRSGNFNSHWENFG
jgi:hypothetical protein